MKARGRMLRKDAASSKKLAALSPKALALFLMLIPHFDSHGKLNGDVRFVKGEAVPLIPWFTIPVIRKALAEIDVLATRGDRDGRGAREIEETAGP